MDTNDFSAITRKAQDLFPGLTLMPAAMKRIELAFRRFDYNLVWSELIDLADEQVDGSAPRSFWKVLRARCMASDWVDPRDQQDRYGFTPTHQESIANAIRSNRFGPNQQWLKAHPLADNQMIYHTWLEQCGYKTRDSITTNPGIKEDADGEPGRQTVLKLH